MDREISTFELDILGEIGNIGSGNAATALSQLLNKTVFLKIPTVKACNLTDIPVVLGGAEVVKTGVFFGINGDLNGYIMFILDNEDVNRIGKIAAGDYEIDSKSVLSEISNIISGAYIGSIATMIEGFIDLTPPEIGEDMIGSLIDSIVSSLCSVANKTVVIETKLIIGEETVSGNYILMLEPDSLNKLLDYFSK